VKTTTFFGEEVGDVSRDQEPQVAELVRLRDEKARLEAEVAELRATVERRDVRIEQLYARHRSVVREVGLALGQGLAAVAAAQRAMDGLLS